MIRKYRKSLICLSVIAATLTMSACSQVANENKTAPLTIQEQGSFAVGGTVVTAPGTFDPIKQGTFSSDSYGSAGQTLHGDHAYVFYQTPVNPRSLPLVFLHGTGQFSKTWETTPDGREGFQNIFLRRRFPVYLMDLSSPFRINGFTSVSGPQNTLCLTWGAKFLFGPGVR